MGSAKSTDIELKTERYLRSHNWIVVVVSLITVGLIGAGIYYCMLLFREGHHWSIIPAAIFAHAYFVIVIHDGAHKAISRTWLDHLFMNLLAGFMLLPFFPEPFRKFHLIHHGNTNKETDPLWSPVKSVLFKKNRYLYIICQLIPFVFTFIVLINSEKYRRKNQLKVKGPPIRWYYVALAFMASAVTIYFVRPPLWFVLGTIFCLTTLGSIRHWCEHMGEDVTRESNTYWFPLGMGVGNHDVHHDHPNYSWISLMVGLFFKRKDTNPFKTIYGIFLCIMIIPKPNLQEREMNSIFTLLSGV